VPSQVIIARYVQEMQCKFGNKTGPHGLNSSKRKDSNMLSRTSMHTIMLMQVLKLPYRPDL